MLKSISIIDYRNISLLNIDFDERVNIFIGKNGQGKTNIIEAIYSFSTGKAFRLKSIYDAIQFKKDSFHIEANIDDQKLGIHCANIPKKSIKFVVDNENKSYYNFIGHFYSVLFSPNDLNIIYGPPSIRRDFIDSILINLNKEYAKILTRYKKIIKQRNALLKKINDNEKIEELYIWDNLLKESAEIIWEKRINLINNLEITLRKFYNDISERNEDIKILYTQKKESDDIIKDLKNNINKDIILGTTSIGPHRDNFDIFLREKKSNEFSSQGEVRSIILSLKCAELKILENHIEKPILLLLDDVFSELDDKRRLKLLKLIEDKQVIITSTHLENIFLNKRKIIKIDNGNIS